MLELDDNRFSYIRAVREVGQTPELVKFLANVGHIGHQVFGYRDSTLLRRLATPDEELAEDYVAVHDGVGVAAVEVYKASSLRLTHFERRARATDGMNRLFSKVYERVSANEPAAKQPIDSTWQPPDLSPEQILPTQLQRISGKYGFDLAGVVPIRVESIFESTQPEYAHLGSEYALRIEADASAAMLREQSAAIHHAVQGISAADYGAGPYEELPLAIPFVRLPAGVEDDKVEIFTEWVGYGLPLKRLRLGPIEWQAKNRS
jgi:hypothetical protein